MTAGGAPPPYVPVSQVPTALIALNLDDALFIADKLNRRWVSAGRLGPPRLPLPCNPRRTIPTAVPGIEAKAWRSRCALHLGHL